MNYKCIKFTDKVVFRSKPRHNLWGFGQINWLSSEWYIEEVLLKLYTFKELNQSILDEIKLLAARFVPKDKHFYTFELSDGKIYEFVLFFYPDDDTGDW